MSILVIAPHGMDEALGCGGLMHRSAAAGQRVVTLVLFGDGTGLDARRREAGQEASQRLGSLPPRYAGFPENRSDTLPLIDVVGVIERTIAECRPRDIYVSHGGNLNIDHQTAFRATVTAARPVPGSPVQAIHAYEVLSSTDWAPPSREGFAPNLFVDVGTSLEAKLAAVESYACDLRQAPHARSLEAIRALARLRGSTVGFEAAEAFVTVRRQISLREVV